MSQVRSGSIISRIRMLQHVDRLYYGDTNGGVYTAGATVNYLFGYADDLVVVVVALKWIRKDLDKFRTWKANKDNS